MNDAENSNMGEKMNDFTEKSNDDSADKAVHSAVMTQNGAVTVDKPKRDKKPRKTMKQRRNAILEDFRNAPIYWGLFLINLVVLLVFGGGVFNRGSGINENFLLSPSTVSEKPWTIVTSAFMHVGIFHFIINMYALKSFLSLDKSKDAPKDLTKGYVAVYVLSIFAAGLFVILFSDTNMNTAGASGAIFGIFGAMITHHRFANFRVALIITLGINIGISFGFSMISWQAHMGGLALGLVAGYVMNVIDFKKMYKKEVVEKIKKSDNVLANFLYKNYRSSMLFFNSRAQARIDVINDHLEHGIVDMVDVDETLQKWGGKYPGQLNVNLLSAGLEKRRGLKNFENYTVSFRNRLEVKIDDYDKSNKTDYKSLSNWIENPNNDPLPGVPTKVKVDESYSEFYDGDR